MDIKQQLKTTRLTHLFKIHHKIKLHLDKYVKEISGGDLDLEEFMKVYNSLKKEITPEQV